MTNDLPLVMPHPQLDPHYLDYARQLRRLHMLIRAGEGDTDRADEIRDVMDALWETLSPESMDLARGLSADLNTIGVNAAQVALPEKEAEVEREIQEAASANNDRQALSVIRNNPGVLPAAAAASDRWVYWLNIGDLDSCLLFWEEAFRRDEKFAKTAGLLCRMFYYNGRLEDAARFVVRIAKTTEMLPTRLPDLCRKYLEALEEVRRLDQFINELRQPNGDLLTYEALKQGEEEYREAQETMSEVHSQMATLLTTPAA